MSLNPFHPLTQGLPPLDILFTDICNSLYLKTLDPPPILRCIHIYEAQ